MPEGLSKHWSRSIIRAHNARMIEKGYHAAVVPIPPYRKAILSFCSSVYWSGREELAYRLAPWLRDA